MAEQFYTFINAAQITQLVPPTGTQLAYQITGEDPTTGIIFVGVVSQKMYETDPAGTATYMNYLGNVLHDFTGNPHVTGLTTIPVIDQNNNVQYWLQVSVQSTSGKSSAKILAPYPTGFDYAASAALFNAQVAAEVAQLDAVEAA